KMYCIRIFSIVIFFIVLVFSGSNAQEDKLLNKEIAVKYGLDVPPPMEDFDAAPEWLQEADMFTSSGSVWNGYDIELKDTLISRIVRLRAGHRMKKIHEQVSFVIDGNLDGSSINGVSLISHSPHSKAAFEQAHEQGFRAVPYVHFRCIHTNYADQDVFYFQHPEILVKDFEGHWVHTPMDGADRLHRFLTCANSPSYWKLSLAYVKKMMDMGADGVFIDNVARRKEPCYGPNFNVRNPEFEPYVHEHLFPDATHDYAFDRFLQAIYRLVKSYGNDKVVILNSGIDTRFQKDGDCCMWESFIYSWAWEGRRHTWEDVKARAKANEWFLKTGRRITALSTISRSRKEAKEDAFWAFSAARLVDFIWWASLNGTGAEALYQAHIGKTLEPYKEVDQVAYKTFENGVIVLNDSMDDRKMEITLAPEFHHDRLLDLYDGNKRIKVRNGKITVTVPKKKARVYIVM
ncbi:hypothetical protein ACFL4Z_03365, partial [candidate division KSB1 bacterium]